MPYDRYRAKTGKHQKIKINRNQFGNSSVGGGYGANTGAPRSSGACFPACTGTDQCINGHCRSMTNPNISYARGGSVRRRYAQGGRMQCPPGTQWNGSFCGPYNTGGGRGKVRRTSGNVINPGRPEKLPWEDFTYRPGVSPADLPWEDFRRGGTVGGGSRNFNQGGRLGKRVGPYPGKNPHLNLPGQTMAGSCFPPCSAGETCLFGKCRSLTNPPTPIFKSGGKAIGPGNFPLPVIPGWMQQEITTSGWNMNEIRNVANSIGNVPVNCRTSFNLNGLRRNQLNSQYNLLSRDNPRLLAAIQSSIGSSNSINLMGIGTGTTIKLILLLIALLVIRNNC